MQVCFKRIAIALLILAGSEMAPSRTIAAQPFYYYPAYGSHRGRIVYHQGPFGGSKQKIHWGGGITDNGAAVLTTAIGAAATIFGPDSGETKEERASRDAAFQQRAAEEQDLLAKARELQGRTEALRASFMGGQPPPLPQTDPLPQQGLDSFSNWDSNASAAPVQVVVPPPPAPSIPSPGRFDTFDDWDSDR
jgi:hypothetical protein